MHLAHADKKREIKTVRIIKTQTINSLPAISSGVNNEGIWKNVGWTFFLYIPFRPIV